MIRRQITFIIMLFFISCQTGELDIGISDFVEFDKAFVPFNYYCTQSDMKKAVLYAGKFETVWTNLKTRHSASVKNGFFKEIDKNVRKSVSEIKNGESDSCQETLTEIKYYLYQFREENKISYFPDYLVIFQESVDNMMLAVTDEKNMPELDEFDLSRISDELNEAYSVFSLIENSNFDSKIYEFDEKVTENFKKAVAEEKKRLSTLEKALTAGNSSKIKKNVILVNEGYNDIYRLFGDFSI
ncbi:MAG: hypothetical protein JW982_00245 [Spirochaetes bacterium]|nr:hypothetical protein [Spirochaetota bacterium]